MNIATGEWKYCGVCPNSDYTLRCLEYTCSVSPQLRRCGLFNIVKKLTNVL